MKEVGATHPLFWRSRRRCAYLNKLASVQTPHEGTDNAAYTKDAENYRPQLGQVFRFGLSRCRASWRPFGFGGDIHIPVAV